MRGIEAISEIYVTPDTLDRELERWMTAVRPYQWRKVAPFRAADAALQSVAGWSGFVVRSRDILKRLKHSRSRQNK